MTVLRRLDRFLLYRTLGNTLLFGRITFVVLVVCGTWSGVLRSEHEPVASADMAAANTARTSPTLLEREGQTADLGQASDCLSIEDLPQ